MTRALLQQALDALESCVSDDPPSREAVFDGLKLARKAIDALRSELAKPAQNECDPGECFGGECIHKTAQPAQKPRQWVGLTERERDGITRSIQGGYGSDTKVAFAIEAALREKNAAQPAQEPLTDKIISKLWSDAHNDTSDRMAFQVLVRLVEAAHGIGGKAS